MNIAQYLERFFPNFEPELRNVIADRANIKKVKAKEMLMATGQNMRSTVLIVEGMVKLYREGEQGSEFFMYYLHPGDACALSLICAAKQETSQVMAKAVEDTTILMIPISLMDSLMKDYKSWYYFVLETYRTRFEELLVVIDNIAFRSMDERLANYLERQYNDRQKREIILTHSEIAADLNSSREVISRLLKKMEQKGHLRLYRNYIEYLK
mgnify:CR=1 FL=1